MPNGRFVPLKDLHQFPEAIEYRIPRPGAAGDKSLTVGKVEKPKKRKPGRPPKAASQPTKRRGPGRPPKKRLEEDDSTDDGSDDDVEVSGPQDNDDSDLSSASADSGECSTAGLPSRRRRRTNGRHSNDVPSGSEGGEASEQRTRAASPAAATPFSERRPGARKVIHPERLVEQKEEGPQLLASPRRAKEKEEEDRKCFAASRGRPKKKRRGRPPKRKIPSSSPSSDDGDGGDNSDDLDLMDWKIPSKSDDGPQRVKSEDRGNDEEGSGGDSSLTRVRAKKDDTAERSSPVNDEPKVKKESPQSADSDDVAAGEAKHASNTDPSSDVGPPKSRDGRRRSRRFLGDGEKSDDESDDESDDDDEKKSSPYDEEEDLIPLDELVASAKAQRRSTAGKAEVRKDSAVGNDAANTESCASPKDAGSEESNRGNGKSDDNTEDSGDKESSSLQGCDLEEDHNNYDDNGSSSSSVSTNEAPALEPHRRLARQEGKEEAIRKFKFS